MSYEKRTILLIVEAYPEVSKRYGNTVCTAGVLEDTNELVRIYPISYNTFQRKKLGKFIRISALIKRNTEEKLKRKESYKINEASIKIIDKSLKNTRIKGVWEKRKKIIEKFLTPSVEILENKYYQDKTSIGIIKPILQTIKFQTKRPIEEIDIKVSNKVQEDLFGVKFKQPDRIEKAFFYHFKCFGENCKYHDKICTDWELYQSFRKWRKKYITPDELEKKLKEKYEDWMKSRDLFFILGTHSQFPTWFIIGLFYPPKPGGKDLFDFIKKR